MLYVYDLQLWCTSHQRDAVLPALKKSLQTMGVDYVDNYLIHWPIPLKVDTQLNSTQQIFNFIYTDI